MSRTAQVDREAEKTLIQAARRGDQSALEALIHAHRPSIKAVAARLCKGSRDIDDLEQEGLIAFMEVVDETFDLDFDNALWTYAEQAVEWRMRQFLRAERQVRGREAARNRNADFGQVEPAYRSADARSISAEQGKGIEDLVRRCLGENSRAIKWIILFVLKHGWIGGSSASSVAVVGDLHVRFEWKMITDDLSNAGASIGSPVGDFASPWACLCRHYGLSTNVPSVWRDVIELFHRSGSGGGRPIPELTSTSLSKFYSRGLAMLRECLANKHRAHRPA